TSIEFGAGFGRRSRPYVSHRSAAVAVRGQGGRVSLALRSSTRSLDCTGLLRRIQFTSGTLKDSFDERCLCPFVSVSVGAVVGSQTPLELAVVRRDVGSMAQEVAEEKVSSPECRRALDRMEMIGARSLSRLGK